MAFSFGIITLIIPLALLVATVWLWVRVVRGFSIPPDGPTPTCAACGAGVRGIASLTCPECGADLREVGIATPTQRRRVSPLAFILAWTFFPLLPAIVLGSILVAVGPTVSVHTLNHSLSDGPWRIDWRATASQNSVFRPNTSFSSSSHTVNGLTTSATTLQLGLQPSTEYDSLQIDYGGPSGRGTLLYLPDKHAYRVLAPNTPPANVAVPLAQADLPLAAAGPDPHLAGIVDIANGLADRNPSITVQGWASGFSGGSSTTTRPAWWYLTLLITAFAAVYIAGLVLYFRLRTHAMPRTPAQRYHPTSV